MGTEVLRPQDCLARQAPSFLSRRRLGPIPNRSAAHKLFRKVQSPEARRRRDGSSKPKKPLQQKQLVMGQVAILKRGNPMDVSAARREEGGGGDGNLAWDAAMLGTGRLGPEPAMVPKHLRVAPLRYDPEVGIDGYAGSAFSMSPSPRSLPLPSFSRRGSCRAAFDRSATVGLRRLLRLE